MACRCQRQLYQESGGSALRGHYLTGDGCRLVASLADDIVSASFASFSVGVHELTRTHPVAELPIINAD